MTKFKPFSHPPFPPLDTLHPPHPYEAVHQWLCFVYGAHPDDMVVTDPGQNFAPVVDLEPLMRMLGGPWEKAVRRCHEKKDDTNDKRKDAPIHAQTGDEKDGSFLAGAVARAKAARGAVDEPIPINPNATPLESL